MKIRSLAIGLGALCLAYPLSTLGTVKTFNYNNILIESLRLNHVDEFGNFAEDWLIHTDRNTYSKYKNDEFEFQDKLEEAEKKLQKLVQKEEPSKVTFNIPINSRFGEYDFKNKKFAYQPLSDEGYVYVDSPTLGFNSLPRRIKLYVSNPNIIDGIPMEKTEAKKFLQQRKNQFGNIDRDVLLFIHIQFETADDLDTLTGRVLDYEVKDKENKIIYQQKISNE